MKTETLHTILLLCIFVCVIASRYRTGCQVQRVYSDQSQRITELGVDMNDLGAQIKELDTAMCRFNKVVFDDRACPYCLQVR